MQSESSQDVTLIIQPTSLAALTWAGAASGTAAQSWRIGTVLSARPLGISPQGMMVLQIGAMAVEADVTSVPLPAQFQVRVLSMGAQPLLEVLSLSSPAEQTSQRALLERLPQQNGYAPLLATLGALSQRPALRQLPQELRTALAMLENAMPTPADVTTGAGLRQAILHSGLFFESELAHPQTPARGTIAPPGGVAEDDWKGALLRLLGVLEQYPATSAPTSRSDTPPPLQQRGLQTQPRLPVPMQAGDDVDALLSNLRSDVKAAVARVEVAQLDATILPAWMIEIPIQGTDDGGDILQLHLEHLNEGSDSGAGWTLGFALDLPSLGPVQGELQLREPRLSVRLWASHAEAAQRLERQFTPLRQRLAACGLLLDQLSCQVGLPLPSSKHSAVLLQATA